MPTATIAGMIRSKYYTPLVRGTYGGFEAIEAAAAPYVESLAAGLPPVERRAYLTGYSGQRATEALDLAEGLTGLMP